MEWMYFIGVTTSGSRIMDLFPLWAEALGLNASIRGVDLPLGASRDQVRDVVRELRDDADARGALVTSHKVTVGRHSADLLVEKDYWASLCGEVSCLAKRPDGLHGSAKDPVTSWKAFMDIVAPTYFTDNPESEVLCLGAGGSGTAFTSRLLTLEDRPRRIHVTNRSPEPLESLAEIHAVLDPNNDVLYHRITDHRDTDRLVRSLPPGSVVVNATGLGKDRPGSPIGDDVAFPERGVIWEFNYRGSLEFLAQARSQAEDRHLIIEDGWRYFLYGWSEHIADVFEVEISPERFDELAEIAEVLKPVAG